MLLRLKRGLTLIEVLIVVTILLVVTAILFPVFSRMKVTALETSCIGRISQLYMAIQIYAIDYPGYEKVHENVDMPNSLMRQQWLLYPYIDSPEMLFCPATPSCAKESLGSTYLFVSVLEESSPLYEASKRRVDDWFSEPGSEYPVILCLVHDEMHYYPGEKHLAEDLNPPFVIRLKSDGSIKKGRFSILRDHNIARSCGQSVRN